MSAIITGSEFYMYELPQSFGERFTIRDFDVKRETRWPYRPDENCHPWHEHRDPIGWVRQFPGPSNLWLEGRRDL